VNKNCFSILNLLNGKKLIRKFCLINLLIIFLIPLSFKIYQIYLINLQWYLFYFDFQYIFRNEYLEPWTELSTHPFIIFIFKIVIFYSNHPCPFLFRYLIRRLNKISLGFDLVFTIILHNYFVCYSKVRIIF
jgi:hypothetical protein